MSAGKKTCPRSLRPPPTTRPTPPSSSKAARLPSTSKTTQPTANTCGSGPSTGSLGSLSLPGDRSGQRLALHLDGADPIDDQALLDLVPDHRLDDATAALFGGDRLFEYHLPFPETDRKLIAVEYHELGTCIQQGRQPEVNAYQGARSVGLSYSLMESQVAGRALAVDAVCDDQINAYQAEINEDLGL